MKLYSLPRVERIEASPEFIAAREASANRRAGARRAAETKSRRTIEEAQAIELPPLVPLPPEELVRRACEHYNALAWTRDNFGSGRATPDSDPAFLARICVNYLRHECTHYDKMLTEFMGRVGTGEAYHIIRERILDRIEEAYPWLAGECTRQWCRALREPH